jgi:hypothetical protein
MKICRAPREVNNVPFPIQISHRQSQG